MKNVLEHGSVLAEFAASNVMLVFDFDGTLAPIADDPALAKMRRRTRTLLANASGLYPCAILSGRARQEIVGLVEGSRVDCVVGNHGLEWGGERTDARAEIEKWRVILEERLGSVRGVFVEDKGFSIAIHFRKAVDRNRALPAIRRAVSTLGRVRVVGGDQALNLVPRDEPHKGDALLRIRRLFGCDSAIYVGDDDTDEDVFAFDEPWSLLGIRVGPSRRSRASYFVPDQRAIDTLLEHLVRLRRRRAHARRSRG